MWQLTAPYFLSRERSTLRFGRFFKWTAAEGWIGAGLLFVIIAIELGQVGLSLLLNSWNAQFYNALQMKDVVAFWHQLLVFSIIAAAFVVSSVYQLYLNQWLQIRWRRWLTDRYLVRWLENGTHYRMRLRGDAADNPDQRISEDIAAYVSRTLSLGVGILSSLTSLVSFSVILWGISAEVPLQIGSFHLGSHGYLVWIAAAFALLATLGAHFIGRSLAALNFSRQRREANLRFALVHLRENSEQIALLRGEEAEFNVLRNRFSDIVTNWHDIMRRQKFLTFFTAGYNQAAVVLPFLIMAPHYFAGAIMLGVMTQTAGAFGQVQSAFSFFVNSYTDLAEWVAIADRLTGFTDQIQRAEHAKADAIQPGDSSTDAPGAELLSVDGVSLSTPNGEKLLNSVTFGLRRGESALLIAPSGTGKTTLLRAILGYWPHAAGEIRTQSGARLVALPQKPYLPLGSLYAALTYPSAVSSQPRQEVARVLDLVGLGRLETSLDDSRRWSEVLSPGEQQRVALARAVLLRPDILLLDEATSALDEAAEARVYRMLRAELPNAAILSIGHRSSLLALHERVVHLHAHDVDGERTSDKSSRAATAAV
ncbi:MAG: ABC transporter ATP-binding protein/permease [Proteobacteria bacterium]|nr:ABC transporter ATP-binding protein/permease [Pseudomonadota bacterium]